MPLIKTKPSPTVASRLGVEVVTTTIFSPSPSAGFAVNARPSLPVPAIAGGVVAGAVLAVVMTFIWIWWGRKIKQTKQKQQEEVEKHRRTRHNTMRNARISGPKNHSYRPLLKRPPDDKRVKFAGDAKATASLPPADAIDPEKAKHMLFDNPNTLPPRPAWTIDQRLRRTGSVIWPMPRNPLKKLSQNSIRSNNAEGPASQTGQEPSPGNAEKSIPHKASNVSANSNASGESRQGRVPANLILAALGNLGSRNSLHAEHADDRQSSSSLWSYLFRAMPGARASQHSSDSAYHPPEHDQAFPVGTAL